MLTPDRLNEAVAIYVGARPSSERRTPAGSARAGWNPAWPVASRRRLSSRRLQHQLRTSSVKRKHCEMCAHAVRSPSLMRTRAAVGSPRALSGRRAPAVPRPQMPALVELVDVDEIGVGLPRPSPPGKD